MKFEECFKLESHPSIWQGMSVVNKVTFLNATSFIIARLVWPEYFQMVNESKFDGYWISQEDGQLEKLQAAHARYFANKEFNSKLEKLIK